MTTDRRETASRLPAIPIDGIRSLLLAGLVIPAHPLALDAARRLDERRQVALSRYYCAAGAGALAVGVHTTQFAIHDPRTGLFDTVLRLAHDTMSEHERSGGSRMLRIAGICGLTEQAVSEARLAREIGYDLGLLSLGRLRDAAESEVIEHCRRVAEVIPLFGFYLQPAVGGRHLSYSFWRDFLQIEAVCAVKVAPFDRYRTLDVVRALADSGRGNEIALYTGNDDSIVNDLLFEHQYVNKGRVHSIHFAGGLLGQWAVWTRRAVELLDRVKASRREAGSRMLELLSLGSAITDANAAIFDAANEFSGCIPGIHEILRRQGLLAGRWCLDPLLDLSPGQGEEITRVLRLYPHLTDDSFVAENLDRWLS